MKKSVIIFGFLIGIFLNGIYLINADGMYIPSNYELHMNIPDQKAIINWYEGNETMIIASSVRTDNISNIAWIVPIESSQKPEIKEGNLSIFQDLVRFMYGTDQSSLGGSNGGGGAGGASSKGVNLIETKSVGIYNISILSATCGQDLVDWLNDNGYRIGPDALPILNKYVNEGNVYFIANKIDLENKYKAEIDSVKNLVNSEFAKGSYLENPSNLDFTISCLAEDYHETNFIENSAASIYDDFYYANTPYNKGLIMNKCSNFFLTQDFLKNFNNNYGSYTSNDGVVSGEVWSWIASSFENTNNNYNDPQLENLNPGIYCYNDSFGPYGNINLSKVVLLISDNLIKRPVVLGMGDSDGTCFHFYDLKINVIKSNLQDFYNSYMDTKNQIASRWNGLKDILETSNFDLDKLAELGKTQDDLKYPGISTPLIFNFKTDFPNYPLVISSVNKGTTNIDVYVLSRGNIIESNNILKKYENKTLDSDIASELSKYFVLGNSKYVTRFSFKGDLNQLIKDAKFTNPDINCSFKGKCPNGDIPQCNSTYVSCVCGTCLPVRINPDNLSGPIDIPILNDTNISYVCNGCILDSKCYVFGFIKDKKYCDNTTFADIKILNSGCQNNFECESNLCIKNKCVSGSLWAKIMRWFASLFGGK